MIGAYVANMEIVAINTEVALIVIIEYQCRTIAHAVT